MSLSAGLLRPGAGYDGGVSERAEGSRREPTDTGLRRTRQRAVVDAVLDEADDFLSAQELHGILRDRKSSVGLATVYRTLQALAEEGRVDVLRLGKGEAVYRRCAASGHHHHLVCRSCGAAVDFTLPSVEQWAEQVASTNGYTELTHTLEIFGLCPRCSTP